jgi:hypothetical protein
MTKPNKYYIIYTNRIACLCPKYDCFLCHKVYSTRTFKGKINTENKKLKIYQWNKKITRIRIGIASKDLATVAHRFNSRRLPHIVAAQEVSFMCLDVLN